MSGDGKSLEDRVLKLELLMSGLSESVLDIKENIGDLKDKQDTHRDLCLLPKFEGEVRQEIKELNNKVVDSNEKTDKKLVGLGSVLVGLALTFLSALSFLQINKVSAGEFDTFTTIQREESIRRDTKIETLYKAQNEMQTEIVKQLSKLEVEIAKLNSSLETIARKK